MRAALLAALAACGFPRPDDVGGTRSDAASRDDGSPEPDAKIQASTSLTNFRVLQSVNASLPHDLHVVQSGTHIDVYAFEPPLMLVPSFDTGGTEVTANGVAQQSGTTSVPLTGTVTYLVTGGDGSTAAYTVTMHAGSWSRYSSPLDELDTAPVGMAVGDLDGDAYPDVVVSDKMNNLFVYRNTSSSGTPSFARVATLPTTFVAQAVAIADLDGDGRQDIAIGGYAGASIAVYLNRGGNSFSSAMQYTAINQTTALIASKLTSNTVPDLLTTTGVGNGVAQLPNNNAGPGTLTFSIAKSYGNPQTDENTVAIAVLDWNDDQKPDLVIAAANAGIVRVLSGASGYSSVDSVTLAKGSIPRWIATGDLDDDGKLDLAVATAGVNSILLARHGNLSGVSYAATTGLPNCVGIADLDGDGRGDLIATSIATQSSGYVETLISGTDPVSLGVDIDPLASATVGCAVADVDHDGEPDFLTVGSTSIRGSVLRR